MEAIIVIGVVIAVLLFLEAASLSAGADSREGIGDDHVRHSGGAV